MRLINTRTGLLEKEFFGDNIPEYAILSHTWEEDEVSLQDFQRLTNPDFENDPKTLEEKNKAGFSKIMGCVRLAASQGIQYVWVDTCCIDKTSSADLTESINSMYQWYANSKICFAYLSDINSESKYHSVESLGPWMESRWFTRGWTLQELIAPPEVEFYDHFWGWLGRKGLRASELSKVTGIGKIALETNALSSYSIAQKMSWASNRITTRKEDMAYCLLGLFDINMPLLYGEGDKAFLRLQEHIAVSSTDHSLFAWGTLGSRNASTNDMRLHRSIFARSPADFRECQDVTEQKIAQPNVWTQTNRGFHAVFPTIPATIAKQLFDDLNKLPDCIDDKDYLAILNCQSWTVGGGCRSGVIGIWISLIDARDDGMDGFCRVTNSLETISLRVDIYRALKTAPDKFRKDLWFLTSRMIQVPRDYFSKRLRGFLIEAKGGRRAVNSFKIHSHYDMNFNGNVGLVLCPLLPLAVSGGLVGVATFTVPTHKNDTYCDDDVAIIFGYPPSSTKPFAKVVIHPDHKALLRYDLQSLVELDNDDDKGDVGIWDFFSEITLAYRCDRFDIRLSLDTVLHEDMVFTKLHFEVY